jgi:hypothetical protein
MSVEGILAERGEDRGNRGKVERSVEHGIDAKRERVAERAERRV